MTHTPISTERLREALETIRDLNMTNADENGHRWANSDLIDQEIIAALNCLTDQSGSETVTDELTEDAMRREAMALLKHNGWKEGDTFNLHSVLCLMVDFGRKAREITDACGWPDCGCCHDASCLSKPNNPEGER